MQKYHCSRCGEIFEIVELPHPAKSNCPRCASEDCEEYNACSLEICPPPWVYQCQQCRARFRVTAPRGPDEAKAIQCPACRSSDVKWLALSSAACATGG
ncbi:MAG: hypothetical protein PHU23_05455 [Dehalococcoidales bacterium]|nr:hypothetical protein [Dehalococcoidales bacterium]